ncbi:type IV secretory system conjugative DNA transfer family protein [Nitrospira defluvii]|uniref:TRAG family protein n=1 Tax=Nitrospira defluvii TaxID=330214 RepID=A0ABM8R5U2_9BACT|nr:TraM recognition domain-containing protein [Nitrospira defluvii]CAE6734417.1 TRAG family protein [Nitrospira defluvii]
MASPLERLRALNREGKPRPVHPELTLLGFGANLDDNQREGVLVMRDADRSGHFGCLGTTRVGKTRLMENIVEQDIRKGYSVVVVDPKGDIELFSKVVQTAAECGRLKELMLLTPIFPDESVYLDPLSSYYMEDELVNHIVSGIKAREDFYIAIATQVAQVIVAGLIILAKAKGIPPQISFYDVKLRAGHKDLMQFRDTLQALPGTEELCMAIDQITHGPNMADFYAKVSTSLQTMLSALTFGTTGRIIGKAKTNEFIRRLESGKRVIMVCNTGSLLTRRTAHIIAKVFISMIQSLVGRLFASGRALTPPLCLHIDEGHNVLYPDIKELFNKGGGANIWIHLYTQSLAQIQEEVGPYAAQSIMDNINSWAYFLLNHPETAQYVEDSTPLVTRDEPMIEVGGRVMMKLTARRQVLRDRVMSLPKRWFYFRTYGQTYKGQTLDTTPLYVKVKFPVVSPLRSVESPAPASDATKDGPAQAPPLSSA